MTDNPDETLPVELRACPFCGEQPTQSQPVCDIGSGDVGYSALIECRNIDCLVKPRVSVYAHSGYRRNGEIDVAEAVNRAIAAWNRRAAQSPPPVVSEGVEEIVERLRHSSSQPVPCYAVGNLLKRAADLIERISSPSRGCDAGEDYGPGSPWSEGYNSGFAAASREPSRGCDLETVEGVRDHAVRLHEALGRQANSPWGLDGDECDLRDVLERYFAAIRNLGKETREG